MVRGRLLTLRDFENGYTGPQCPLPPYRPLPRLLAADLLRRIRLTKRDYQAICGIVSGYHGSVVAANLDSVYQRFPAVNATRAEFYTSLSDGK
jgi:hypothetical protein